MNADELANCLKLLEAADAMLLEAGENILAAHLSAVIEPLKQRVATLPEPEGARPWRG